MSGLPWWAWVIVSGVLGLGELHVPGAYLIWIALGAALTGAADAAFGLSLEGQLAVFVAVSVLSSLGGYFVYRRLSRPRRGQLRLNQRNLAMVGTRGIVCEAFINGHGKVRLGDGVWLATGPDFAEGTPVVINAVRGTRLFVEAATPKTAAGD
jgi:hypothetical protein